MHEYHKAVEWVEAANQKAQEQNAAKVTVLHVTNGESSGYSMEVVKNYFDEAAAGTACEGASFDVTVTRSMLKCPKCGRLFEKKLLDYQCPDCHVEGDPTESGNEVLLTGVDLQ